MKQETGSSTSTNNNKQVSIQLKLGGHSFSAELISDYIDADVVEILLLTHKYTLVPKEQFDDSLLNRYLELNGLGCSIHESAVAIHVSNDIIAISAINKLALEIINSTLGSKAKLTSPFTTIFNNGKQRDNSLYISILDGVVYIMLYNDNLKFAEAFAATTLADYIYISECLSREFATSKYRLHLSGEYNKEIIKVIKPYFKSIVCE